MVDIAKLGQISRTNKGSYDINEKDLNLKLCINFLDSFHFKDLR